MADNIRTQARDSLADGVSTLTTNLLGVAQDTKDLVKSEISESRERAKEAVSSTVDRIDRARDFVSESVHTRPGGAALAALGVGVLIGLMLGRHRR